jgi:probable rRNA maturation factor
VTAGVRHRISLRQKIRPAPFSGNELRKLVARTLDLLGSPPADLRILVVGDAEMARWNERFMGHEGTTNVISFPEDEPAEGETVRVAGDILLSAPTCLSQTEGWAGTPEERVLFFILHGTLHLLGYDHVGERSQARRMRSREMKIYRAVLGEPIG